MSDLEFASNLIIKGKSVKEVPCLIAEGAPDVSLPGGIGSLYMDLITKEIYKCVNKNEYGYAWIKLVEQPKLYKHRISVEYIANNIELSLKIVTYKTTNVALKLHEIPFNEVACNNWNWLHLTNEEGAWTSYLISTVYVADNKLQIGCIFNNVSTGADVELVSCPMFITDIDLTDTENFTIIDTITEI